MSSIISGYNYDIFISYRQKDNKHDGWVTEFVDNLKGELESTFKEEISVYFDINPHDGLLETHDVDESLKEKLKCLVFIPIISRTYCDPKSFAWEHEFKAFVGEASQDQFGLKIKLPGGNVASRVLPVRIHDLDNADIKECESVLGGVLRGVEFIYKESGFNRPLKPDDDEKVNLNKTKYRNQITKVALAIKEITLGMKAEPISVLKEKMQEKESLEEIKKGERIEIQEKPTKASKQKLFSGVAILGILIIAAILIYPKIFKRDTLDGLRSSGERISVAVMPFQNMTNDTIWNVWQDGIQEHLTNSLSNSEELKVRQTESIKSVIQSRGLTNYASITPSFASTISQKLDASVFVYGNITQAGTKIRVSAQLIDSKTEEVFKSFQIEESSKEENIFQVIDSLSAQVKNFLLISKLEKETRSDYQLFASTNSPEAYRYFMYGNNDFFKADFPTAIDWFSKAVKTDSNFVMAMARLSYSYGNQGLYEEAKKWCLKAYGEKKLMSIQQQLYVDLLYATNFETNEEEIKVAKRMLDIDDQLPIIYYRVALSYIGLHQYDRAIPELGKALDIYKKWGLPLPWVYGYTYLGLAYHETGQFKNEKKLYKIAEQDFPDAPPLIYRQIGLALTEGDINTATEYIEKETSILKDNSANEAYIITILGNAYSEAYFLDKAEEYYRKALSLEPENPIILYNLAFSLIEKDRNVSEGLELVEKALMLSPDNFEYLDTKGWGLYKQGKYQEALDILQKSWDLRREKAVYDYSAFLHLEAAKKAVAGMKNN